MRSFNVDLTPPSREEQRELAEEWDSMDETERKVIMLEQRLAHQDQRFAQQEQVQRVQRIEREVNSLQEKYGEFDGKELVNHAIKHRIPNLDAAYAHWRFNDVKSVADKLTQDQEITSKKRDASVVTTGGSSQATGDVESTPQVSSLRDAFALAKKQLNN